MNTVHHEDVPDNSGEPAGWDASEDVFIRDCGPSRFMRRVLSTASVVLLCLVVVLAGAGGFMYWRLEKNPIELSSLNNQLAAALTARAGPGYKVSVGKTYLEKSGGLPSLVINRLSVLGADGKPVLNAPRASVGLDVTALLGGSVRPRRLAVSGLDLRVSVDRSGGLAVSAGQSRLQLASGATPKPPSGSVTRSQPKSRKTSGSQDFAKIAASMLAQLFTQLRGSDSLLGGLKHVGIEKGRLLFSDQSKGNSTTFDQLEAIVSRSSKKMQLSLSAKGANGRWKVSAAASLSGPRRIAITFENLSLDEISLAFGLRDLPIDFDTPLSGAFDIAVDASGQFTSFAGKFSAQSGYFLMKHPDFVPFLIDQAKLEFAWNKKAGALTVRSISYRGEGHVLEFSGTVTPPESGTSVWRLKFRSGKGGKIASFQEGEPAINTGKIDLLMDVDTSGKKLKIERFSAIGPDINMLLSGSYSYKPDGRRFRLQGQFDAMPVARALSLWPGFLVPPVRNWMRRNLTGGRLEYLRGKLDFGEEAFAAMAARQPMPAGSVDVSYKIAGSTLRYLPGVTPISQLHGEGRISSPKAQFKLHSGVLRLDERTDSRARIIRLTGGRYEETDTAPSPSPVKVLVQLEGSVKDVASYLRQPGLAVGQAADLDVQSMSGKLAGKVTVNFRSGQGNIDHRVRVEANANVSSFRLANFIGEAALEKGNLKLVYKQGQLSARGLGRIFGAPAKVTIGSRKSGSANDAGMVGTVSIALDDAARRRLGWTSDGYLSGMVIAKLSGAVGKSSSTGGDVHLDLSKAAIKGSIPALAKPIGAAAVATFKLVQNGKRKRLESLVYRSRRTLLRGTVDLDASGRFSSANLNTLRLSPGDDLQGRIVAKDGALTLNLSGTNFDARPFIEMANRAGGQSTSGKVDVSLTSDLASGFNGKILTGFKFALSLVGQRVAKFHLDARAGRARVTGRLKSIGSYGRWITITSNDAGTVLSFMNIYKRMRSGILNIHARIGLKGVSGALHVRKFVLHNEPALRKLVSQSSQDGTLSRRNRIDPDAIAFKRLQFQFQRGDGVLAVQDGVINGPEVGLTLQGRINFKANRVAMNGTFVPAYGLNNAFARIPLFGALLAGGRNEGLLGVNFRVSGRADAPILSFNPLSAIAPGFLRKLFGVIPPQQQPLRRARPAQRPAQRSAPRSVSRSPRPSHMPLNLGGNR